MRLGEPSVKTSGISMIPVWCVDSLVFLLKVSVNCIYLQQQHRMFRFNVTELQLL